MAELTLGGCTPTPMASYLKGLGILRLLAEQRPEWSVRVGWRGDRLVLSSPALPREKAPAQGKLEAFFLEEYQPTPIVAPWNGGSGFYPKDNTQALEAIARGAAERFASYRSVIDFSRRSVQQRGLQESPKNEAKGAFLMALRAEAPECLLDWLDAAVLLAGEDPRYPPLLGTGGNDGRLDFTNNFMQRLCDLIDTDSGAPSLPSLGWLRAALFAEAAPRMASVAVGQFNPGGVGGPNASSGFDGGSLVNPWDFVLMLEGAVLFAAAATRRLETVSPGTLAYPFTVRTTSAGNGGLASGDQAQARAEIWMPLWHRFASVQELKRLLSEGRATLSTHGARDGLGFARAVAALGVDRGIAGFQRFGFLMRSGKAYLATPLARVPVKENPRARLIEDLESGGFLDHLRRFARDEQAPAGIRSHVRRLEDALFDLARGSDRYRLQKVLRIAGRISFDLAKSTKAREAVPRLPRLTRTWVDEADDGSAEFRCAAALAGFDLTSVPLTPFVLPVSRDKSRYWQWAPESRTAVWHEGDLCENLGRVATRCNLESADRRSAGRPRAVASAADLQRLIAANLDERRLSDLMLGLVLAEPAHLPVIHERVALPGAYCALKPFFAPRVQLVKSRFFPEDRTPVLPSEIIANLRAGHTQRAVDIAWRRLRALEVSLPRFPREAPTASGVDGARLLAALLIPLDARDLKQCLATLQSPSTRDSDIATGETV